MAADAIDAVDAGERLLKGFSRPLATYAVQGLRTETVA
jgi:class 3 adenylate cyclase